MVWMKQKWRLARQLQQIGERGQIDKWRLYISVSSVFMPNMHKITIWSELLLNSLLCQLNEKYGETSHVFPLAVSNCYSDESNVRLCNLWHFLHHYKTVTVNGVINNNNNIYNNNVIFGLCILADMWYFCGLKNDQTEPKTIIQSELWILWTVPLLIGSKFHPPPHNHNRCIVHCIEHLRNRWLVI